MSMTIALLSAVCGFAPEPVTVVRPLAGIVEIRPQMLDPNHDLRRDQVRDPMNDDGAEVVGEIDGEGDARWYATGRNERARRGGEDAPALIYVRAFDGVFAIDPFEPLPQTGELSEWNAAVDETTTRQVFGGLSLETDRSMFGRRRIERTEELFRQLERARVGWLREHGYLGVRSYVRPAAEEETAGEAEPAGWFRKPAEMPRGRSRESVQREAMPAERARGIAANVLEGATRVSLPPGTDAGTVERVASRERGVGEGEVARND